MSRSKINNMYITILIIGLGGIVIVFFTFSILRINSDVHQEVTIKNSDTWGYGTYKTFVKEVEKRDWDRKNDWPESYFHSPSDSRVHASIFRFNGKGMVLGYWDYRKAEKYLKKNSLQVKSKKVKDWE